MTLKPGLGVTQRHRNDTVQSGTYDYQLTFHSNYRPISHCFQDKQRSQSKLVQFPPRI